MGKRSPDDLEALRRRITDLEPGSVDELYELEPAYEPGRGAVAEEHVAFRCPHCSERNDLLVDLRGGERCFAEACQSCGGPLELALELTGTGVLRAIRVRPLA